ncbi:MAG: zinc-ribbon domain-containing protein [Gemmataceae bacterium]|nr:zinc-ribbon domain-containing protein [Gemmataceae bacterium]
MPITFACPHCATPYKLRDELAGKKAKCRNPACGQLLTIPRPDPSVNGVAPSSAEVEAAALAALADEAKEEVAAAQAVPMTCSFCEHKWTEPVEKAGKNVLCPNPECRQRQKVPVPKSGAVDWRVGPQGPSLAKENFERPDDIMGGDAKIVSQGALEKAGATNVEYEPVPLKRKLMWAAIVLVPLALVVGGVWYVVTSLRDRGHNQFMAEAAAEFEAGQKELPAAEAGQMSAVLHIAAGEYELRQDRDREKALGRAVSHFTKARTELQQAAAKDDPRRPTGPERSAVAAELAAATLSLGGSEGEIRDEVRIRWVPEVVTRALRANEKSRTVHQELSPTLQLVQPADLDLRTGLLRRLARELARRGQPGLALDLPGMFFADPERPEARAWAALEVYRADNGSGDARAVANDLRAQAEKGGGGGPAAQLLWRALGIEKTPLPPEAASSDPGRLVAVGLLLVQGQTGEALDLARKPGGSAGGRLRALALCGEWGADPGAVAEAAAGVVEREPKGAAPPYVLLRLAQAAAAGGKADQAKALADAIPDEGLRAWARAEVVRAGTGRAEEDAVEAPDDPKKVWAGHAWGRLWVARRNAKESGDGAAGRRAVDQWPAAVKPFGLAGIALGLKDR